MNSKNARALGWFRVAAGALLSGVLGMAWGADGRAAFPDADSAWIRGGIVVTAPTLRMIEPGLTRNQVYALIGPPHFAEAGLYMREWNYLVNLKRDDGSTATCQLQLHWSDELRIETVRWKTDLCGPDHPVR